MWVYCVTGVCGITGGSSLIILAGTDTSLGAPRMGLDLVGIRFVVLTRSRNTRLRVAVGLSIFCYYG
jgi:hypothetical protein